MLLLSESSAATLPGDPDVADDNDDQRGREPGKDHLPAGLGTVGSATCPGLRSVPRSLRHGALRGRRLDDAQQRPGHGTTAVKGNAKKNHQEKQP